jgi:predicted AAA+ superfamily ATPase
LLLEHLIAFELVRRSGSLWPESKVSYYRTRHGAEVDFILEIGREIWAIEVKASRNAPTTFSGFESLAQRTKKLKRKLVVFLGPLAQRHGDVEVLPLMDFLALLPN